LPKGRYRIFAYEAEQQPADVVEKLASLQPSAEKIWEKAPAGRKLTSVQFYFLGGDNDVHYKDRLKEYHERLRGMVAKELEEIKMVSSTVEKNLFNSSV